MSKITKVIEKGLSGARVVGGTWTGDGTTWTLPAFTLGGAVAGGDQAFTNVGDMTFAAGSILASGSTNGNTLLLRANDTTFITFTTGATDVCALAGVTLSGTLLASGTVTMPALTLGGAITGASQNITGLGFLGLGLATTGGDLKAINNNDVEFGGSAHGVSKIVTFRATASGGTFASPTIISANTQILRLFAYPHDGNDYYTTGQLLCQIDGTPGSGSLPTKWVFLTTPSGSTTAATALTVGSDLAISLAATGVIKVGTTQVVGARVVDARCDDVVNSGDATTDGVIDALRDAMIAHGLIAAA